MVHVDMMVFLTFIILSILKLENLVKKTMNCNSIRSLSSFATNVATYNLLSLVKILFCLFGLALTTILALHSFITCPNFLQLKI
jgi:hypothetical protein